MRETRLRVKEWRTWHKVILCTDGLIIDPYSEASTSATGDGDNPYTLRPRNMEKGPRQQDVARPSLRSQLPPATVAAE